MRTPYLDAKAPADCSGRFILCCKVKNRPHKGRKSKIGQKNIEKTFSKQLESVENLQSHIDNWKNYFEKKDFDNMQKEFELINKDLEILVPMENTINKARVVQNLHTLIKNRDQDFNLSKEEMELCEKLV